MNKKAKTYLSVIIISLVILSFSVLFVSAGLLDFLFGDELIEVSDKDFNKEKYQTIETEYITFELPKTATHYWGTGGLDNYEVIVSNFSIKDNNNYILKFTWQDERYISETIQIHYDFKNGELKAEDISYNSLSKYNKSCMDGLSNPSSISSKNDCLKGKDESKLRFKNINVEIGELEDYDYKLEYNETCLYYLKNETNYLRGEINYSMKNRINYTSRKDECLLKVAYPVYSWSNFSTITTTKIPSDFLAIDDVAVSACGVLNTAGETYNQNQNIDAYDIGSGDCIIISNENITFNGNGYWIKGDYRSDVIVINSNGVTIKNTNLTGYSGSISEDNFAININANNSYIYNNSIFGRAGETYEPAGIGSEKVIKNIIIDNNYFLDSATVDLHTAIYFEQSVGTTNNITIINNIINHTNYGVAIYPYLGNNINISSNNITNTNGAAGGAIEFNAETTGSNLTISNNRIEKDAIGILVTRGNVSIEDNTITNCSEEGIYIDSVNGGEIIDNIISFATLDGGNAGIYLTATGNVTIQNNNLSYSSQGYEIYLEDSSDNIIDNNNLTVDFDGLGGYTGIYITGGSGNNIQNHLLSNNFGNGITLESTTNNQVINNTIVGEEDGSLYLLNTNHNSIINNTIVSGGVGGYNVYVYRSDYNNFTNNIIENCTFDCIRISSGDYNIFDGGIIRNAADSLIYMDESVSEGDSESNEFKNLVLINSTDYDIEFLEDSNYHTFLNVTFNESRVNIVDGRMIVKWYLDAQVNDSVTSNPIQNVNVSGGFDYSSYDSTFSILTNSTGEINTTEYTSYRNWDGSRTYYNITFTKLGYHTNSTNYTGNLNLNLLLVPDTENPNATLNTPGNNTNVTETAQNFTVSITDDLGIKNATLFIYNSTGDLFNQTTETFSGGVVSTTLGIVVNLVNDVYTWFYEVFDWAGNSDLPDSGNYTVNKIMGIDIITPTEGQIFIEDQPTAYFNISTTTSADVCYWSEDSGLTNYTMTNTSVYNWTLSNISMVDGFHNITFSCNQSDDGTWRDSESVSFDVDSVNVTVCRDLTVTNREYKIQKNLSYVGVNDCDERCLSIDNSSIILNGLNNSLNLTGSTCAYEFGIYLTGGNDNITIFDLHIDDNGANMAGIGTYLDEAYDNGNLTNVEVYNVFFDDLGLPVRISSNDYNSVNITFHDNRYSSTDSPDTFVLYGCYNFTLRDETLDKQFDVHNGGNYNIFNVTYSSEEVTGTAILTRKWYFQTQVNDSTGDLQNAQVEVYDKDSNLEFSELTDANGNIDRLEVIDYVNNGGTKTYNTPHEINTSLATYTTNSTFYNFTLEQNIFHYVTLELSNKAPTMNLSTPSNNSYLNSLTNDMVCNSTDSNGNLKNVTIFTWTGGVEESRNTKDITGSTNETVWTAFGFTGENIYEWNCYTCDTDHECAWDSNWTLTIDTTLPNATHIYPNNTQNTTLTQNLTVNLTDTRSLGNVTLNIYNSTDLWNQTTTNFVEGVTESILGTVIIFVEGIYEWFWEVFDRAGNSFQSTNQTITIDQTAPSINIVFPINGNSYTYSNISINYTITDNVIGVDSCWYTNDSGANNYSTTCGQNFTQNLSDATYTYVVYSNDSLNNLGSDSVTFTISTLAPAINLNAPLGGEWFSNGTGIYFNFTATDADGLDTCELWGNWTGTWGVNYTWTSPTNATMNWTQVNIAGDGEYEFGVWCNDTLDNEAFSTNRTFNLDETFPNVTNSHFSPTTVYTETTTTLYGNITDTNLNTVWIEINYSGVYQNHTVTNVVDDSYYYILHHSEIENFENISWYWHANDSANNVNSSSLNSFKVSNRNPYEVNITSPINNSFINTDWIWINFTAIDDDADTLNFTLYNSTDGTTFSLYNSTNLTYLNFSGYNYTEGAVHYLYLTANDTELQNKSTNITFTIDKTNPGLTLSSNAPSASPTPLCSIVNIELNYSVSDTNLDYCTFNVTLGSTLSTPNTLVSDCSNTTFNVSFDNTVQQLNLLVVDKAGNSNLTTRLIYLNTGGPICSPPSPPTTVGGGGTTLEKVLVVAVITPIDSEFLSNLQRAIIYKEISEVKKAILGTFSISLTEDDLSDLKERLQNKGITMDNEELTLWVENFEQGELDEVFLSKENFENFNLVLATGTYCGDGFCQNPSTGFPEGNDLGMLEGFFNCQQDCPPPNIDSATLNCIDFNPDTPCIWSDLPFQYVGLVFGLGGLIIIFSTKMDKKTRKQVPLYKYYAVKLMGKKR